MMATNILKSKLDDHGFTQTELSEIASISVGTINKVCNQRLTPAPKTLSRIVLSLNKLAQTNYQVNEIFDL